MLQKMVIRGGQRLSGRVRISGAKNAALPILCASLLSADRSTIHNVPELNDISSMKLLLQELGVQVEVEKGTLHLTPGDSNLLEAPYEIVRRMRASVLVLGPLLARYGRARVSLPGGCAIGERPIDQHLKGLEIMGADITLEAGYVEASASRLKGDRIVLDLPTVTGTENLLMAATLAEGTTIIENAAREPEIVDLANCLRTMGARIQGDGSDSITIEGVDSLSGATHSVIPDRIEMGTYMVAAAITKGKLLLQNGDISCLDAVVAKLKSAGVLFEETSEGVIVQGPDEICPVDVRTVPHPGFPTDMQAQFMALMCHAKGMSMITETLFENRYMHVPELRRMGADISLVGNSASVRGGRPMSGASVMATDLRASASLVLAGLAAAGTTEVLRIYHLDRGYERMDLKLQQVGADVERVEM